MKFSHKEMSDLLSGIDISEGETINVHHCKSGHNNDRCYISHNGDVILFYCHHCGKKGGKGVKYAAVKRKLSTGHHSIPKPWEYNLPADAIEANVSWPVDAEKWLITCGITKEVAYNNGLVYSPRLNRVCIPVIFNGKYKGYVARKLSGDGPKYLARAKDKQDFIYSRPKTSDEVIIVEDIASCIRCSELSSSVALQGTDINDKLLSYLINSFSRFIIWLDNDNPTVKLKQAKLLNKLRLFGEVKLIKTEKDPKEYDLKEIQEIIKDA